MNILPGANSYPVGNHCLNTLGPTAAFGWSNVGCQAVLGETDFLSSFAEINNTYVSRKCNRIKIYMD